MFKRFLFLSLTALPAVSFAQSPDLPNALTDFEAFSDILPVTETDIQTPTKRISRQQEMIPYIASSIDEIAAQNIKNPEQVFCYHVTKRPKGYTGYTLNNFAITGYCGELDRSAVTTIYEALFTKSPNIITAASSCRIEPKIMLRFVKGVDTTDILLSSPCPSFTSYYAGKYKSFNIKQGVIDDIITELTKKNEPFNSPSLLAQTVANGTPATTKDTELLEKKQKEHAKSQPTPAPQTENKPAATGWGNINLKFKNKN